MAGKSQRIFGVTLYFIINLRRVQDSKRARGLTFFQSTFSFVKLRLTNVKVRVPNVSVYGINSRAIDWLADKDYL